MMIALQKRNLAALRDGIFCGMACIVFAWFIHAPFPLSLIAFASLAVAAFIISRQLISFTILLKEFYHNIFSSGMIVFNVLGIEMGIVAALYYRHSYGMFLFPSSINSFAIVAVGIAIVEELVFRGFIQGELQKVNTFFSVVFASLAHALYKSTIFLAPFLVQRIDDVALLFFLSFFLFLALGLLKHYAKSIVPCIIAHVIFDFIVYAEIANAPWWVW
jgi:membrane protease YdiL (CAAX protease family)